MTTTHFATIAHDLRQLLGPERVLDAHSDLMVYECDAFVLAKNGPDVVVFPESAQEVAAIVRLCDEQGVSFVPRGAGTSLAGGSVPVGGGVMIVLTRMSEILEVNLRDRYAVVEPGVVNAWLDKRPGRHRLSLCARPVEPGRLHDRRQCGARMPAGRTRSSTA